MNDPAIPTRVEPVEKPVQRVRTRSGPAAELAEVDSLIRAAIARQRFDVDGEGMTAAVLDTGLRDTHVDFADRVLEQRNFTSDNHGDAGDARDGNGHGTNVTGIVAAGADHIGVAPGANVVPVKVLDDRGGGSFEAIRQALEWVLEQQADLRISAVCMSLGDGGNHTDDAPFADDRLRGLLRDLRAARVVVAVASGNDYFTHRSAQGMSYPAILRECLSVGAVYDAPGGPFTYGNGATARSAAPDRLTPFSQRLHESRNAACFTRIFAPGAPTTSSGIENDHGESVQQGTSQATPVVVGTVLLLQELAKRATGRLPAVDDVVAWLRTGARRIHDGDDEDDNVEHTRLDWDRVDVVDALGAVRKALEPDGPPPGPS